MGNIALKNNGDGKFLLMFADALEQADLPGAYTSTYP